MGCLFVGLTCLALSCLALVSLAPSEEQIVQVLGYVRTWNTNAKTSTEAQAVLHAILTHVPTTKLQKCSGVVELIDGLVAYTERHFQRIDQLVQQSFLVDHSLKCMEMLMPVPQMLINGNSLDGVDDKTETEEAATPMTMAQNTPAKKKRRR